MTAEADFAAWLDQHDAAALARVFDAIGGRLLLLAAHLGGDGATAADLVQSTFLAALARGASWDRARPLWPWLAAILHNELLMERRRQRRRREVDLDRAQAVVSDAPDPARLAASTEALDGALRAIDALPLPYRRVLRLRLVHGLTPIEIARSLELPVGTVRAQLHRGLERMRSSLPSGVVGLLAALTVGDDHLLAQVRERVLEHAATTAPAMVAAPALLGGWAVAMKGKTIGIVVVAGLLLAATAYAGVAAGWFTEPARTATLAHARSAALDETVVPTEPEARREPVAETAAAPWPLEVTVREVGGAPIAGARVEVWTAPSCLQILNQAHGEFGRRDVAAGDTAADGVFRATLGALRDRGALFRGTNLLWIRARWPHGPARDELLALPRTGDHQTFAATLELARQWLIVGRLVDGRVIDGRAAPRAGAKVLAITAAAELQFADSHGVRTTDRDGNFALVVDDAPDGDPDGDPDGVDGWPAQLAIVAEHAEIATVAVPARPATVGVVDLGTIALPDAPPGATTVRGILVLGDGLPLARTRITIDAVDPQFAGHPARARRELSMYQPRGATEGLVRLGDRLGQKHADATTQVDGTFTFADLDPAATYLVQIQSLLVTASAIVRAGAAPVRLQVDAQLLTIEPRAEDGELLPGAQLLAEAWNPANSRPSRPRPGFPETGHAVSNLPFQADDAGRLALLSPFGWVWRIATNHADVAPAALRHDALPGMHRATRTLDLRAESRFGKLHVVAGDGGGGPPGRTGASPGARSTATCNSTIAAWWCRPRGTPGNSPPEPGTCTSCSARR